jgi:C-terminal processing protease CtpA/Prc
MSDEHTKELVMKSMVVLTMLAMGCSASAQMPAPVKPPPVQEKRTAQAQGTLDSDLAAEQARDAAGQARDAAGQARDAAGQARDLVGHARDVAQQQYRLVEGKKVPNDVNAMVLNLNDFRRSTGAMEKGTYAGISVSGVPAVVRDQLELPRGTGLVVDFVEPGSPAEAAGLQRGDVVQEVNHEVIKSLEDYQKAAAAIKKDEMVRLYVARQGNNLWVAISPK